MQEGTEEFEAPLVFVCVEVDLDYEFDAPQCFDLCREELPEEASAAELWFENAGSYPPSPLVAKIMSGDVQVENISATSNINNLQSSNPFVTRMDVSVTGYSRTHDNDKELFHNSIHQEEPKVDHKSTARNPFPRGSTLMKPTASQLAKQNKVRLMKGGNRFHNQFEGQLERISEDPSDYTHQAAKRQRLERDHFCKVAGVKKQDDLFHKVREKKDEFAGSNSNLSRLKLTIPREPELQTARRALKIRVQQPRSADAKSSLEGTTTFKARPLNRKILEAPSLPLLQKSTPRLPKFKEFNLRSHERAIQHGTIATSSSMINGTDNPIVPGDPKGFLMTKCQGSINQFSNKMEERKRMLPKSCAQSLNKKEFKFRTSRRAKQDPLAELFNKLSLTSGAHNSAAQFNFHPSSDVDMEDSKENMVTGVRQ